MSVGPIGRLAEITIRPVILSALLAISIFSATAGAANAGIELLGDVNPSFTVYNVAYEPSDIDETKQGFLAAFIDALTKAAPDEDIGITVRRVRATLGSPDPGPKVVDLLEEPVNLKSAARPRRALLVAVTKLDSDVSFAPAPNAERLDALLQAIGYKTKLLVHPEDEALTQGVNRFARSLKGDEQVVVYFSGPGFEISGVSYLFGADFNKNPDTLEYLLPAMTSIDQMRKEISRKVRNAVFVIDIKYMRFPLTR